MQVYEDLIAAIEEMICTSTAVMAPYPVDVVGRPAPFTKSKKKSHGEKRAPHTEIHEEYEKQNKGSQKPAMMSYKYKKLRGSKDMNLQEMMLEIAEICEAIKKLDNKVESSTSNSSSSGRDMSYLYNKIK